MGSKIEYSEKLLIVVLLAGSSNELTPGSVDHIENLREAELARIDAVTLGRQAHNRPHQIVSRDSHKDFFSHHFLAPGVDVVKTYRSLQRAQVGFDVPAPAIHLNDSSAGSASVVNRYSHCLDLPRPTLAAINRPLPHRPTS